MTPKEQADEAHSRQRKQLYLDVFVEVIKQPNMDYKDAHFEASWSVKCFDQAFGFDKSKKVKD